ncbi:MAG: 4a-hydroxytetrahydrobiopterin dehydratase [Gammaproteobacteria bacterium]|nr:4a-hydroxytetrahydrobiopterin dehydratase [Gammaproteobacteria bacterium]NVK89079.1 4a-hydroxytetrahydrobiopterin dehydratase [Gammaproteobacteria bacterium]
MNKLVEQQCRYDDDGKRPLEMEEIKALQDQVLAWDVNEQGTKIARTFHFKNYYHTMNFVNAIAWIANKEAHHPDMQVSYGHCEVVFTTHDSGNRLTINDFICAAKVDDLLNAGNFGPKLVDEA